MNDDDRHLVRFVFTRDGGVDADFATGLCEWFEPDRIVAEHYDVVDEVEAALRHLVDAADGRTVSQGRVGTFEVDPDTGRVVAVKVHENAFDVTDGTHDDVAAAMLRKFDGVAHIGTRVDDDAYGCRVEVDYDTTDDTDDDEDDDHDGDDPVRVNVTGFVEVPADRVTDDGDVPTDAVLEQIEQGDFYVDGHDVVELIADGGIIVADDDGEIIDDDEDDDRVDPDDEGVEILTDGGVPTCESCGEDDLTELPDDDNRGSFRCEWCGAFVDEDGRLPRADDKRCPKCHGQVAYGVLKDARKGIRGYLCVGECDERRIVRPEDEPAVATDGGRPALSSFDHAPTVGPSDVDKCRECGRYAPHAFDHAPDCSCFESIDQELSSRTAASNPRMVRTATDGGKVPLFDRGPQSPEQIASNIVAATEDDTVAVWCGHGDRDDVLSIFEGTVESTTYREHDTGGEHIVIVDVNGDTLSVSFGRSVDPDDDTLSEPAPEAYDPQEDVVRPVTRFEGVDG